MFKKSILAAALAVVSINASAIAVSDNATTLSVEGLAAGVLTANKAVAASPTITLGAEYTVGDTITFTIAGGTFDDAAYALTLNAAGGHETVTWGLLTKTATTIVFRATAITAGADGATTGATYDLDGDAAASVEVKVASIAAGGKVIITTDARTSTGIAIDVQDVSTTADNEDASTFITGANELKLTNVKMAAQLDVGQSRQEFVDNTKAFFSTDLDIAAAGVAGITYVSTAYTLHGDFTGVKDVVDLGVDTKGTAIGDAAGDDADNVKWTIAEDKMSATKTVAGDPAAAPIKIAFDLPATADKVMLKAQDFTLDVSAKYDVTKAMATGADVGSWTLNGSSDDVAFLPFGDEYAQSITVTNTGTVDGAITVALTAGGETFTKVLTATATPSSVTNISTEVSEFAKASGITSNAAIEVVVNSPDNTNQIQVKAVYFHKATQDRVLTH